MSDLLRIQRKQLDIIVYLSMDEMCTGRLREGTVLADIKVIHIDPKIVFPFSAVAEIWELTFNLSEEQVKKAKTYALIGKQTNITTEVQYRDISLNRKWDAL